MLGGIALRGIALRAVQLALGALCLASLVRSQSYTAESLVPLMSNSGIIRLSDATADKIMSGPRDYTVAVLLTAEGQQYQCGFCQVVAAPYAKIASSWHEDHPTGDGLFFAVADISENQGLYARLGLQHAPNLYVYPPSDSAADLSVGYDTYKFPASEDQVQSLLEYFRQTHNRVIEIHEPFPWDRIFISIGGLVVLAAILRFTYPIIIAVAQNKQIWLAVSMVALLMFTSGHMFNIIRRTPYLTSNGRGGVDYFVPGHSNQIAVETQIIGLVYGVLAFTTVSLIVRVPRISDPQRQMFTTTIMVALILVAYSFLMAKFKVKNDSFPFKILDIF